MINPTVPCVVVKTNGTDVYGRVQMGQRVRTKCNIVQIVNMREKSSVRADSSASRGRAHEFVNASKLLFQKHIAITLNDIVEILDMKLQVKSVFPRHDVHGKLDHYEVELAVWE